MDVKTEETFASIRDRLEEIAAQVKGDDVPLDAALDLYDEAVKQLCKLMNDEHFEGTEKSRSDLLSELLTILIKHPKEIVSVNVEQMIRNGIRQFEEDQGKWWCMYAEYFQRMNNVEKARDV